MRTIQRRAETEDFMSKITIQNVSYHYADFYHPVFENISLLLDTDWKTGLIGRNGRGKTTFFKLLTGELEPTAGTVYMPVRGNYFPYQYNGAFTQTLDIIKELVGGVRTLELAMEELLSKPEGCLTERYFSLLETYQTLDGYTLESRIYKEAEHMQLRPSLLEQPFSTLSGGEKTRILILALFLRKESYVLLDEPTNHLDTAGKLALISYLKRKKGFLVISHDGSFLNEVTDHILSINKTDITLEQGSYASWKQNVLLREQFERRTKERLEQEIRQLERQAASTRTWSDIGNTQKYRFASHARTNGTRAYMRQAKHAENQILKNMDEKKLLLRNLEQAEPFTILQEMTEPEDFLLCAEHLDFSYIPDRPPLLKDLSVTIQTGDRIWLKGKNGAGKSTLLKLLSGEIPHAAIRYAEDLKIAVSFQEPKWKHGLPALLCEKEGISFDKFFEFAKAFDLPEDFHKRPIETLSSGEQKKLDIARALACDHRLLFLDEPLNFMDVLFREQLEAALLKNAVTVVFAEHNKEFGSAVATGIIEL